MGKDKAAAYIRHRRYFTKRAEVLAEALPEIATYVTQENPLTQREIGRIIAEKAKSDERLVDFRDIQSMRTYKTIIGIALRGNNNPLYGDNFPGLITKEQYTAYTNTLSRRNLEESPNTLQNLTGEQRQKRLELLAETRGTKLWEPEELEKAANLKGRWSNATVAAVINGQKHDGKNVRNANSVHLAISRHQKNQHQTSA